METEKCECGNNIENEALEVCNDCWDEIMLSSTPGNY